VLLPMKFELFKRSGLITISHGDFIIHLGVYYKYWIWGKDICEYAWWYKYIGCGPLFLIVRKNKNE